MSFSYFIGEYHHFRTSSICFCTCVCGGVVLNPCIVSVSFLLFFFFCLFWYLFHDGDFAKMSGDSWLLTS